MSQTVAPQPGGKRGREERRNADGKSGKVRVGKRRAGPHVIPCSTQGNYNVANVRRCRRVALPLPSNWSISWLGEPDHGGDQQGESTD
jgi:hypothetical protein